MVTPNSNTHLVGINKNNWVDEDTESDVYTVWFSDKVSVGVKYFVIWLKI